MKTALSPLGWIVFASLLTSTNAYALYTREAVEMYDTGGDARKLAVAYIGGAIHAMAWDTASANGDEVRYTGMVCLPMSLPDNAPALAAVAVPAMKERLRAGKLSYDLPVAVSLQLTMSSLYPCAN